MLTSRVYHNSKTYPSIIRRAVPMLTVCSIASFSSTIVSAESIKSKDYQQIANNTIEKQLTEDKFHKIATLAKELKTIDLNEKWRNNLEGYHYGFYVATLLPNIIIAPFSVVAVGLSQMGGPFGPPLAISIFGGMHTSSLYAISYGMSRATNTPEAFGYLALSYLPFLLVSGFFASCKS